MHGAVFRLIFGDNTSGEVVDPSTGARIPKPDHTKNLEAAAQQHCRPLASTLDFLDHSICEIDGDETLAVNGVEVCEVNPGADTFDVRRLLLAETRVGVFHISSFAWKDAYQETCQKWLGFVASCVEHQCDFVTGDGNLFAQRSFKNDEHSDFRTSIMIDIIERFLQQININRSPMNRITYNVVSSTTAAEYLRSMHGEAADCDSMVLISLCYGKQTAVTEARAKEDFASADGYSGSAFADEILLTDVEQLKHLLPYDLGLAEKDCAWHSPLLTFAQLKCLKNMRIRTKASEDRRRERWSQRTQGYEDRKEERRERQDSVPPLRRDSHRHVDTHRSRSASRARSSNPKARTPQPPPAPVRSPVTPPKATSTSSQPVRYKAAPVSLKQHPTSTSTVTPPVKAPPVPVVPPARSSARTRTISTPPDPPPRPPSTSRVPWREATRTNDPQQYTRKRPHGVPEPPAPPRHMSGSQWLDQGASASSSTGNRTYGYENYQPPYYRTNPNTSHVEYVPGYTVPRQRWVQKYDGTWLDMIPQTPDQSIFFHQSGELRRQNERAFYGYTFSMGL